MDFKDKVVVITGKERETFLQLAKKEGRETSW